MRLYNILRMKSFPVNELVFATSVLLWDLCLRLYYVLVFAMGKRLFSTWLLLYRTWENRSSSASSTSSARDNWLEDESPDRMPRRMTASSLCLSVAVVKPHHALDAYVSFAMTIAFNPFLSAAPVWHKYSVRLKAVSSRHSAYIIASIRLSNNLLLLLWTINCSRSRQAACWTTVQTGLDRCQREAVHSTDGKSSTDEDIRERRRTERQTVNSFSRHDITKCCNIIVTLR